jgi:hypothetical protein
VHRMKAILLFALALTGCAGPRTADMERHSQLPHLSESQRQELVSEVNEMAAGQSSLVISKDGNIPPGQQTTIVEQRHQITSLSKLQWWQEVVKEVNEMTMQPYLVISKDGNIPPGWWPEAVRKLQPVGVYCHMVNVVIVLRRDERSEEGYYVVPGISSWVPFQENDPSEPGWSWRPMMGDSFCAFYTYTRKK